MNNTGQACQGKSWLHNRSLCADPVSIALSEAVGTWNHRTLVQSQPCPTMEERMSLVKRAYPKSLTPKTQPDLYTLDGERMIEICGGDDDITCQHLNCAFSIYGMILREAQGQEAKP